MSHRPSSSGDTPEFAADRDAFFRELASRGQSFGPDAEAALRRYGDLVVTRSGTFNLVSQADRSRLYCRHLLECLEPSLVEAVRGTSLYVDIGTGAGLPGIPLGIVSPKMRILLVEPRVRRAQFLESALAAAGLLGRAEVFHGTADRLIESRSTPLDADAVTARAVDRLERVWEWAHVLLRPGGRLLLLKGDAEVAEALANPPDPKPDRIEARATVGGERQLLILTRG